MRPETMCIQAGYEPKNGSPRALPIYQSTTFTFDSTEHVGALFDLTAGDAFYTRLGNPTTDCVEKKIAALEGGVGALCTSSGQAASMLAVMNIAEAGDHIIAASAIYGGTFNLLGVTLKKFGVDVTFVDGDAPLEQLQKEIRPNTKAVFGETIANPALHVLDIEKFAALAHNNGIPLIVDNTFATQILCRPFAFGADIIVHSTTKYMDGHAVQMGGVIVDSGKFDWGASGKFPGLTEPDESYHGHQGARAAYARHGHLSDTDGGIPARPRPADAAASHPSAQQQRAESCAVLGAAAGCRIYQLSESAV